MFWIFILGLLIGAAIALVATAMWHEGQRENQAAREDEMVGLISQQRRRITDLENADRILRAELSETDEALARFLDQEIAAHQEQFARAAG